MYLENIFDERNKTQRPREKDGDVFYNKFKGKDNSFTFDAVNSLKIDDNQILEIIKADVHELSRTEKLKSILRYKYLELEQKEPIEKFIEKYADCFHLKGEKLGTTTVISHKIPTIYDIPVNVRPYRFPHALKTVLDKQLKEMLDNEMIESSCSNYSSPVFLIAKTPDSAGNKRYRLVVDFRQLNDRTIKD